MTNVNKLPLGLSLLVCLAAPPAYAGDEPAPQPEQAPAAVSQADLLFQEGKRLLEENKFADACEKLAQSDAIDPAIGTLGLLAACHEQQGRTATAYREYLQTASRAELANDERSAVARERAKALEPELPRITIRLAKALPGVVIFRSGVRVPEAELGVAVPVDPGTYEIVARFPDKPEFRATASASARNLVEIEVPDPYRVVALPKKDPVAPPPVVEAPRGFGVRKTAGLAAAGVSLLGFGVTTGFALSASSKNAASISIEQSCATADTCARGRELRNEAFTAATVANVGFGIGAAGAVTALVLFLLPEPKKESDRARAASRPYVVPWMGMSKDGTGAGFHGVF